jgi:5'-nucleotidase (lipoprotein e(P4) family)
MKRIWVGAFLLMVACKGTQVAQTTTAADSGAIVHGKLYTAIYQQRAAEYKALCYQAFNLAQLKLDAYTASTGKPKAIVSDIDETLLDNSAYAVHQAVRGKDYQLESWYTWTNLAKADTVPGAPSFMQYAAAKGVEVFYITNRDARERAATLRNLQRFRFPNADEAHLLTREGSSSKEARRQKVGETHEIVLLLGDNLADFSSLFDKKDQSTRANNVTVSKADFGSRFIIIPNPNYGDWEGSIYQYKYSLTPQQKDSAMRANAADYE